MSNLIVISFGNEADAFAMRAALAKLQSQYLIEMEDAVVVTRDAKGKVQLHQAVNLTAAGAASDLAVLRGRWLRRLQRPAHRFTCALSQQGVRAVWHVRSAGARRPRRLKPSKGLTTTIGCI